MTQYVAFLRGINIGGKTIVMKDLAALLEKAGFQKVQTVLASGNVVFSSSVAEETTIAAIIEKVIQSAFGFPVRVTVRKIQDIKEIVQKSPFRHFSTDKAMHWYVTFLKNNQKTVPQEINGCTFLSVRNRMLFTVLDKQKGKSTDLLTYLDRVYGKEVTTRNWNTLVKITMLI
ncbi:MAG TPA: DUF1697 domain-containing protein [Patescibacteria group bacterium]|nr:DUF1697 domain-containing protein [Patescibacteria group bacterium]